MANSRPITFPISHGELSPHHFVLFLIANSRPITFLFLMANSRPITFLISHGELSPHHFPFLFSWRTHAPSLSISHGELSPHCSFFFFFFFFFFSFFFFFFFLVNSHPIAHSRYPELQHFTSIQ